MLQAAEPIDLDLKLSPKQVDAYEALFAPGRELDRLFVLLYGGAARGGKSWLGAVVGFLISMMYPGVRGFIGRETLKDVRLSVLKGTIQKLSNMYNLGAYWSFNGQDNIIHFINGSSINLLELAYYPSDPRYDRFGSYEYTWGWIEEAQQCPFGAYEVLRVRIGQHLNDKYGIAPFLLLTSNPGKNWLKTKIYNPWKLGTLAAGLMFIQAKATDNPYREAVTDSSLDAISDDGQRARLKDGDWDYSDDPQAIMSYALLESMRQVEYKAGPVKIAVDVARYGDDSTIIAIGRGNQVQRILERKKQSLDATAVWVRQLMQENNADSSNVIIDVVGLGGGVVDLLRSTEVPGWNYQVKSFNGGGRATRQGKQTEFRNLRGQSYWLLREAAEDGKYSLAIGDADYDLLSEELTGLRYKVDERKIIVEKKEEYKARLGRSPDRADAVTMFFSLDAIEQPYAGFAAR